jgi:hypothetical protein
MGCGSCRASGLHVAASRRVWLKADEASLKNQQKIYDSALSYERTALANAQVALEHAPEAIATDWGPVFNRFIEEGEKMLGDPAVPKYQAAILTFANEYAKIMNGSTGSQGSTVDSRREAAEIFSPYLATGQIQGVIDIRQAGYEKPRRENLKPNRGDQRKHPNRQASCRNARTSRRSWSLSRHVQNSR